MKTTAEKIEVMQAFERGEAVEIRSVKDESTWTDVHWESPDWDWASCDYRIKPADPEPKPEPRKAREWWIIPGIKHLIPAIHTVVHDAAWCAETALRPSGTAWMNLGVHVREVLPGDDDLRAEVELLRADNRRLDCANDNLRNQLFVARDALTNIAEMAKAGAK